MAKKKYMNFLGEEVDKRFTKEYDEKWGIYLSDNLTGDWFNINPARIVDTCNGLWEQVIHLKEENEQLRKEVKNRSAFIIDKGFGNTFCKVEK